MGTVTMLALDVTTPLVMTGFAVPAWIRYGKLLVSSESGPALWIRHCAPSPVSPPGLIVRSALAPPEIPQAYWVFWSHPPIASWKVESLAQVEYALTGVTTAAGM